MDYDQALRTICERAGKIESLCNTEGHGRAGEVFYSRGAIVIQGIEGIFTARDDGTWDWGWRGPNNDKEWAWLMNRQRFLLFLVDAGEKFQPLAYQRANDMLADWINTHPTPRFWSYSYAWRALETARRIIGSWGPILARKDLFTWMTPELRRPFYNSLIEHGKYLKKNHHFQGNHLITEMSALLLLAYLLQDDPETIGWRDYAYARLLRELDAQFFSDGMHRELSDHYHRIALEGFLLAAEIDPDRILENEKWVAAWTALRDITQPNGFGPLSNDGDREKLGNFLTNNSRWLTNVEETPELYFRNVGHSGQFVARRKNKRVNWWVFADFGPYGSDHQHEDRLHVSWSVHKQSLLVDNGRFRYKDDPWRRYFRTQPAHNTVLLENASFMQPDWGERKSHKGIPDTQSGGDTNWCWATCPKVFKTFWGIVTIYRTIVVLNSGSIFIIDTRDQKHGGKSTTHWSFHPNVAVTQGNTSSQWHLNAGKVEAQIELLYPNSEHSNIYKGQEEPFIAGWFAPSYNKKFPAYQIRTEIAKEACSHVWKLSPKSNSIEHQVSVDKDTGLSIKWKDNSAKHHISIEGFGSPPKYSSD